MSSIGEVQISVYVDFLCPFTAKFHGLWGEDLRRLARSGKVALDYSPVGFLDDFSKGTAYSTRSAAVFYLLRESLGVEAPSPMSDDVWQFLDLQFTRGVQPHEADRYDETAGSNSALAQRVRECGFGEDAVACVSAGDFEEFEGYATELTREISQSVNYVPYVAINEEPWDCVAPDASSKAVDALLAAQLIDAGFEFDVLRAMARIPRGEVRSYGELAVEAGHPGAARAVGTVCKNNPLPLIIPCQRVVPAAFLKDPSKENVGAYSFSGADKWELLKSETPPAD